MENKQNGRIACVQSGLNASFDEKMDAVKAYPKSHYSCAQWRTIEVLHRTPPGGVYAPAPLCLPSRNFFVLFFLGVAQFCDVGDVLLLHVVLFFWGI